MSCPIFVQIRSHPVAQLGCDITGTRGFQPVRVFETRDQEKSHCGINLCLIGLKLDQGVTSSILDRLAQTFFCSAQNLWLYNAIITASVKNPWTLVRSFILLQLELTRRLHVSCLRAIRCPATSISKAID